MYLYGSFNADRINFYKNKKNNFTELFLIEKDMNKEFLVMLLQKDIHELSLLTEGFERMTVFPEPMLRLAKQKAENIIESLQSLGKNPENELGEIDYQSFSDDEKIENNVVTGTDSGHNSFDIPTGQADELLHSQTDDSEIGAFPSDVPDEDMNEIEAIPETLVEQATERNQEVSVNRNDEIIISLNEEFQEEIEVEEIGENEQILAYEETESASGNNLKETEQTPEETIRENIHNRLIQNSTTLHESLQKTEISSLGDNLANQKIEDIRQALNIGDRFRFQRELFGNNGETMNKSIAYLNQLAKYEEAVSYLRSKFGWSDDNPHADEFLQIVKRRYL